ncbi:hypothetical protein MMC28_002749 [Mycoblastus sanguinarius]|nr:hypothetical protein [Mycoblastus sanguinarius]
MWYKRSEAQKRYTIFFSSTQLAGAFGGLLASAIGKMNGLRHYHAWRWIFILEGTLTCLIALAAYFLIPDFPDQTKWLSEEERAYIKSRLRADQNATGEEESPVVLRDILEVLKDYKVTLGAIIYFSLIIPAYAFAYFAPTVIQTYKYKPIETQLHSVPPSAAAFAFSLLIAYLSDRTRHRFLFALFPICIAIAGVGILLHVHHDTHTEYAALFLVAMGTYSAMPIVICWVTMNLSGHRARGVGTAWVIGFGNIGGIVATFSFLAKDAPHYKTGYSILMAFLCLAAVSSAAYFGLVRWQNRTEEEKAGAGRKIIVGENEDLGNRTKYML